MNSKVYDPKSLPDAGLCYVCNCIRRLFLEDDVEIRAVPNVEGKCAFHSPLVSWLNRAFREEANALESQGAYRMNSRGIPTLRFSRELGGVPHIQIVDYKGRVTFSRPLFLFDSKGISFGNFNKQRFDPKRLNLQIARRWLGSCLAQHGAACDNTFNVPLCYPAYLIDVEQQCLVAGQMGLEYVALSYLWSIKDSHKTTKLNIKDMATPRILSTNKFTNIPSTIKDAMHVTSILGKRYLWVDSLCLISDDQDHMKEQLQLMGSIYACATVTIVATDGDSWDGLHGIEKERSLPNAFPWLAGMQLVARESPSMSERSGSCTNYFQRGWTYQEYFLSRRRLIFGKSQVHWSCSCAELHEDNPDAKDGCENKTWQYTSIPNLLGGMPDIDELQKLSKEYQVRNFTHEEDALPGLTGLLTLVSHSFKGGFLCGLPEMWFDAALLWQCGLHASQADGYAPRTFLEKRERSKHKPSSLPGAVLPSWSWVSWRGNNLLFLHEEEDYQLPKRFIEAVYRPKMITTPITVWFSSERPDFDDSDRWPIHSFPDREFDERRVSECSEQGWLKESGDIDKHFENDSEYVTQEDKMKMAHKFVYSHPALPNRYFWRPFQLGGISDNGKQMTFRQNQQHQFISCHTRRGWFYARRIVLLGWKMSLPSSIPCIKGCMDAQVVLVSNEGAICGWLQVPSDKAAEQFRPVRQTEAWNLGYTIPGFNVSDGSADSDNLDTSTDGGACIVSKVELAAICRRKRSNISGLAAEGGELDFEYYGVLWIEWNGNVAYRKGCGYVERKIWDEHEVEGLNLILG